MDCFAVENENVGENGWDCNEDKIKVRWNQCPKTKVINYSCDRMKYIIEILGMA